MFHVAFKAIYMKKWSNFCVIFDLPDTPLS